MKYILRADGGSRGNPGPSASGAVLYEVSGGEKEVAAIGQCIGVATNNTAEYTAVVLGLEMAIKHGVEELRVELDSELAVRQLTGVYKIKQPHLRILADKVQGLAAQLKKVEFHHIRRERNMRADELVNIALDGQK